jgi:hypothetical protein
MEAAVQYCSTALDTGGCNICNSYGDDLVLSKKSGIGQLKEFF